WSFRGRPRRCHGPTLARHNPANTPPARRLRARPRGAGPVHWQQRRRAGRAGCALAPARRDPRPDAGAGNGRRHRRGSAPAARGLGWRTMESTWVLLWDNQSTGWVSGVDTRGTATARLRAAGPAGPHHVKLWSGWQGQAYLNPQQAPTWYLPRPEWTFTTTAEPADVVAFVEPYPDQRQ